MSEKEIFKEIWEMSERSEQNLKSDLLDNINKTKFDAIENLVYNVNSHFISIIEECLDEPSKFYDLTLIIIHHCHQKLYAESVEQTDAKLTLDYIKTFFVKENFKDFKKNSKNSIKSVIDNILDGTFKFNIGSIFDFYISILQLYLYFSLNKKQINSNKIIWLDNNKDSLIYALNNYITLVDDDMLNLREAFLDEIDCHEFYPYI